MKESVNFCDFCDRFNDYDRTDNFSYEGKQALFDYLEEYEHDCGIEIELDVIALCCEYTEYADIEEFHKDYSSEDFPDIESIYDATTVILIPDTYGFIIANF